MIDWLACTLVKGIGWLLCRLPASAAVWLGEQLGTLAYRLRPMRTRIGLLNLRAAFDGKLTPIQVRRIVRESYRQLGAGIVELLRLPVIDRAYIDRHVVIEGREHFDGAAASSRPVIILTGHYGNWELSSIVAALHGYPIVALARAQAKFPKLYRLLVSYRESKGCTIVHKGGAMKRLITALGEGRVIGIVGDQASRQGIFIEFFGRPALFATGSFELAWGKEAVIVPGFMHRVRAAEHRLVIEPPIRLDRSRPKEEAVKEGVERFAALLAKHITDDPAQWLWMYKRWKHTPARKVLVLSDGKTGHLKQSLAVVAALREQCPALSHQVVDVRYRHRFARAMTLLWSVLAPGTFGAIGCLQWALKPESAAALLGRYADVIVSCGSSTVPVAVLWSAENRAKLIALMNPAPVPVSRFSLIIAPQHDRLPADPRVVRITGALTGRLDDGRLLAARQQLAAHPKFRRGNTANGMPADREEEGAVSCGPSISVFVGGDTEEYELSPSAAKELIEQVLAACELTGAQCMVTTSRRTSPSIDKQLAARLNQHPRCRMVLLANQDPIDGTMEGMLGAADVAVVTGESVSMVTEACASGKPVIAVRPHRRRNRGSSPAKHERFLDQLERDGYVHLVQGSGVSSAIREALTNRQAVRRLDNFALVREAVGRLL